MESFWHGGRISVFGAERGSPDPPGAPDRPDARIQFRGAQFIAAAAGRETRARVPGRVLV
jgi:hypothetical protein